jgi:hypothetical protein
MRLRKPTFRKVGSAANRCGYRRCLEKKGAKVKKQIAFNNSDK